MKKMVAIVFVVGSVAHAGGKKQLPGASHNPPRFVDDSEAEVFLYGKGSDGYAFEGDALVVGFTPGDRLRLEEIQNGKVLATGKCELHSTNRSETDDGMIRVKCQSDKAVKAKGPVTFDLIYEDDKADKEYLVRRFSTTVVRFRPEVWQVSPDDVIANAYADFSKRDDQTSGQLKFKFWITAELNGGDATLRCAVDGKPLPDIKGYLGGADRLESISASVTGATGPSKVWHWTPMEFTPKELEVGTKQASRIGKDDWSKSSWLVDHPGAWDCQVRRDGRALRELLFSVDPQGAIQPHPMQKAAGPARDGVALIDVRIPKDAALDQRIKPDLLKNSRGFGLPWPADPSVKDIQAALPPAVENFSPIAPPKKAGKVLAGADHNPPRFVDEAATYMMLLGRGAGYGVHVSAQVAGWGASGDTAKLDIKQGGKLLASAKCDTQDTKRAVSVTCETGDTVVTAKGPIEAVLSYHDDVDGNDYTLRTYKANVVHFTSFGDPLWQIVPDDVLGGWCRTPHA